MRHSGGGGSECPCCGVGGGGKRGRDGSPGDGGRAMVVGADFAAGEEGNKEDSWAAEIGSE